MKVLSVYIYMCLLLLIPNLRGNRFIIPAQTILYVHVHVHVHVYVVIDYHYLLQLRQLVVPSSTSWDTEAPPLPSRFTSTATGTSRETKMADSTCGTSGRSTTRLLSLPPAPLPRYRPFRRAQPVLLTHGSIQPCHVDSRINWYEP